MQRAEELTRALCLSPVASDGASSDQPEPRTAKRAAAEGGSGSAVGMAAESVTFGVAKLEAAEHAGVGRANREAGRSQSTEPRAGLTLTSSPKASPP